MSPGMVTRSERTVILNQLMLGLVVLFAIVLVLVSRDRGGIDLAAMGVTIVFIATALALLVRWDRLPPLATVIVPACDIVAIAFLVSSHPLVGLGLLWVFPVLWIALTFDARVTTAAVASVAVLYWSLLAGTGAQSEIQAALLPVTMASLGVFGQIVSRRSAAQRALLARQSKTLQEAFERARAQEALVREVLQAVDFGIIRVAASGEVTVANEAHARLQGEPGAAVFRADGVTPLPADERPLARAQRGEAFDGVDLWYGEMGSSRRALHVTARRIREARDAAIVVVSRDVTAELQALRARADLVASVSHELRTPLTSILGYLELARDDLTLTASTRRALEVADRNAKRLLGMVADILTVSSPADVGTQSWVSPTSLDLGEIARQAVEAALPRAAARDIALDAAAVRATRALADAGRIRQVLDNLLSNAVKYSHPGGHVWVACATEDGRAVVRVRDDGPGIAPAEQERLFERFFRADAVRNSSIHGAGLGLAITRDIVRAHGGEISVRSAPGEGAEFVVALPAPSREEARP